jgi:hypothetical protein
VREGGSEGVCNFEARAIGNRAGVVWPALLEHVNHFFGSCVLNLSLHD